MKQKLIITPIVFIIMLAFACLSFTSAGQDFNGSWKGTLNVSPMSLNLVLNLKQTEQGITATLDSPDQGAEGIPASANTSGDQLTVSIAMLGAKYTATLDGNTLDGTFSQMGQRFPLKMTRKAATDDDRPQESAVTASQDKPYLSEDVTFGHDGITLAGTFTLPKQGTKHPAVVLVSGTGPNDRDETIFRHKPFLVLADHLSRQGVAVLRYDKRGVGGSTPGDPDDTTEQLAQDAMAALRYLQGRAEVDAGRVGMLGHSEGGLIAVMNAAAHPNDVAFIITLAGPAVKGRDLMVRQNQLLMRTMGMELPDEELRRVSDVMTLIDTVADAGVLRLRLQQVMAGRPDAEQQIAVMTTPAYRWLIQCDPTSALRQMKCPMLALNGTLDSQVDCEQNLTAVERLVPHATVKRYAGLNHLFQHCDGWTGSARYAAISQTLDPQVLADIARWITESTK